jgi:ribosomal protein S27E
MGNVMNAFKIMLPLGVAAVIAGLIVGNTSVSLVSSRGVSCGSAFGGGTGTLNEDVQARCAPILSEKDSWATALLVMGVGLLTSTFVLYATRRPAAVPPGDVGVGLELFLPPTRRDPVPPPPPLPDDDAPDASQKRASEKITNEQPPGESKKKQLAPRKTTKARCHHCRHVQAVPISQAEFVCEQCGRKLRRLTAPAEGT